MSDVTQSTIELHAHELFSLEKFLIFAKSKHRLFAKTINSKLMRMKSLHDIFRFEEQRTRKNGFSHNDFFVVPKTSL